jgi:glucokinase
MATTTHIPATRLLADIGGTNARFALASDDGAITDIDSLPCANYPRFEDAVRAYLARCPAGQVRHAVIAIATPVGGDLVKMTNHDWAFSIENTRAALGLATLLVVNDFAALSMAVPELGALDVSAVGGGIAQAGAVIGLVGAGTGLGVGALVPSDGRWLALQSEGGHVAFSPCDQREQAVLSFCWQRYDHVSAERLVSGPGIALIHEALASHRGMHGGAPLSTENIVARALTGSDALCRETLDCFCAMLGTVAANIAVTLCARGGIYIGGGVVPRLGEFFARSPFRARFENKGRFSAFTAQIPTLLITAPYPALTGANVLLSRHLAAGPGAIPSVFPQEPHHVHH